MNDYLSTALIVGSLLSATLAFIWVSSRLGGGGKPIDHEDTLTSASDEAIDHIFNDEFREELRNRGRLHFEKIIGENAMFLQQDLRLTTSQINEYMKTEITKTLQEAFKKYEESITDAKEVALNSIQKTQASLEEQRSVMEEQLKIAVAKEKNQIIEGFKDNMAEIVNHYVLSAVGNEVNLDEQLEYILSELERNKEDILADIEAAT